ncbi:hypothetical protein [Halostagnicola bangensis]
MLEFPLEFVLRDGAFLILSFETVRSGLAWLVAKIAKGLTRSVAKFLRIVSGRVDPPDYRQIDRPERENGQRSETEPNNSRQRNDQKRQQGWSDQKSERDEQ